MRIFTYVEDIDPQRNNSVLIFSGFSHFIHIIGY